MTSRERRPTSRRASPTVSTGVRRRVEVLLEQLQVDGERVERVADLVREVGRRAMPSAASSSCRRRFASSWALRCTRCQMKTTAPRSTSEATSARERRVDEQLAVRGSRCAPRSPAWRCPGPRCRCSSSRARNWYVLVVSVTFSGAIGHQQLERSPPGSPPCTPSVTNWSSGRRACRARRTPAPSRRPAAWRGRRRSAPAPRVASRSPCTGCPCP